MNVKVQDLFATLALLAFLILPLPSLAQSIQLRHSFTGSEGEDPIASLTLGPNDSFYGTTELGGSNGYGTIFEVMTNGALTTLVSFASTMSITDTNGAYPCAALTPGPGGFYGTAEEGGRKSRYGTVFEVTTNGVLTTLLSFANTNGEYPVAGLTLSPDGNFYGTTEEGGSGGFGTVFEVTTNGVLTTLLSFANTNGEHPVAGLTLSPDGNFYGTTADGGSSGYGTVFELTTNGVLTTLVSFASTNGAYPEANLTLGPDAKFYGTTYAGGSSGYGTVFEMTTNGVLTTLASFDYPNGANPQAGLTLGPDGNFYGTTESGGVETEGVGGYGAIYSLDLPPEIIQQPANQLVAANTQATFSIILFGTAPYSFQWFSNNVPIVSGTNATLTYSNVSAADAAGYWVIVTNTWGSITSSVASLAVAPGTGQFLFEVNLFDTNIYEFSQNGVQGIFLATTNDNSQGIAFNSAGDLFVANQNGNIYEYTPSGTQSVFASGLNGPWGLAFDQSGNLFEADSGSGIIYEFIPNGTQNTFATGLNQPWGLAFDSSGNLYEADHNSGTIYEFTPSGTESIFASNLSFPTGLAFDGAGNLCVGTVLDGGYGGDIIKISPNGAQVVFATGLVTPTALAFDANGNLFVSSGLSTGTITEIATNGAQTVFASGLDYPNGLAFEATQPSITTQPVSTSVIVSNTLTLSVGIIEPGPFTYQWYFNGTNPLSDFPSADSLNLTITNIGVANSGNYSLVITSPNGSVTSSVASVTVTGPPIGPQWVFSANPLAGNTANLNPGLVMSPDGRTLAIGYFAGATFTNGIPYYQTVLFVSTNSGTSWFNASPFDRYLLGIVAAMAVYLETAMYLALDLIAVQRNMRRLLSHQPTALK